MVVVQKRLPSSPFGIVMSPLPRREVLFIVFMLVPDVSVACFASRLSLTSFSLATLLSDGVDSQLVTISTLVPPVSLP